MITFKQFLTESIVDSNALESSIKSAWLSEFPKSFIMTETNYLKARDCDYTVVHAALASGKDESEGGYLNNDPLHLEFSITRDRKTDSYSIDVEKSAYYNVAPSGAKSHLALNHKMLPINSKSGLDYAGVMKWVKDAFSKTKTALRTSLAAGEFSIYDNFPFKISDKI